MAINVRQRTPLRQARQTRQHLTRYLKLDGGRYLVAAAVLLALMSLLTLGQTGRLATKGYQLAQIEQQRTQLIRERNALQMQLSEAQSLAEVRRRAETLNLRPVSQEQIRYVPATLDAADSAEPPAEPTQHTPEDAHR